MCIVSAPPPPSPPSPPPAPFWHFPGHYSGHSVVRGQGSAPYGGKRFMETRKVSGEKPIGTNQPHTAIHPGVVTPPPLSQFVAPCLTPQVFAFVPWPPLVIPPHGVGGGGWTEVVSISRRRLGAFATYKSVCCTDVFAVVRAKLDHLKTANSWLLRLTLSSKRLDCCAHQQSSNCFCRICFSNIRYCL